MFELIFVSLLCLSNFVESKAICPSKCSCTENAVDCSHKSLISLSIIDPFINEVDHVDISHNHLSWLSTISVENIDASSNLIQQFPQLAPKVKSLILKSNKLRYAVHEECPDSLNFLDLSENPVKAVDLNCTGLKILNISHSDIEILPEGFLSKFPTLEVLHIDDSPLKKINGDLRSNTLEVLTFQRSHLRYIKPNLFSGLTKLKIINLSGSRHLQNLQPISVAEMLFADHCSIETIDLTGMPRLRSLDVSGNHITALDLPDPVIELNASTNLIYNIDLKKLKRADLSRNKIVTINLKRMDWLDISENRQITLLRLASIDFLDASQCSISVIEPLGSKLHTLNLSHNALEVFPQRMAVRRLDVSYNRLSSFKAKVEGIEEISLIGNRLVLAEDVVAQGKMYLRDNPWTCDCKMDHLFRRADDVMQLLCEHPKNASGKTWMDACYKSNIPKWMLKYPYIPFIISTALLILAMLFFYWLRMKLDSSGVDEPTPPADVSDDQNVVPEPVYNRDLPSYEEALLMPPLAKKVNALTQTRSYEVLSRRLSSNSI